MKSKHKQKQKQKKDAIFEKARLSQFYTSAEILRVSQSFLQLFSR